MRWLDRVAVLTDGESLLADDSGIDAAEEWLFTLAPTRPRRRRPLVRRGGRWPGLEVVAFADLDAVALAVAAWQGRAVRIVPLDERRPPQAYSPLVELVSEGLDDEADLGLAGLRVLDDAGLPTAVP